MYINESSKDIKEKLQLTTGSECQFELVADKKHGNGKVIW